jgi:hypothetical protein
MRSRPSRREHEGKDMWSRTLQRGNDIEGHEGDDMKVRERGRGHEGENMLPRARGQCHEGDNMSMKASGRGRKSEIIKARP